MQLTVGIRRPVMENKLLRAVSLFETLMIDIMLLPKC